MSEPARADGDTILSIDDLKVHFTTPLGIGAAVDGVSFDLRRGETLGLVGESGSGKSLTSLAVMGMVPGKNAHVSGRVLFRGEDLVPKSQPEMRRYRGKHLAMILQDSLGALNPSFTVKQQLYDPLRLHQGLRGKVLHDRAVELLRLMRIADPEQSLNSYPHQFSGGMRQRIVSAIGLAGEPEVLIADEPTTALDVTVQAAYLDLLQEVQARTNVAILFVTHDFGIVRDISTRVAVMYAGKVVETASVDSVLVRPRHPYTKALLAAVPDIHASPKRLISIPGAPPSIYARPSGCPFHNRCWLYSRLGEPERCRTESPPLERDPSAESGHLAACHYQQEAAQREIAEPAAPTAS
jgi:oligopeptide/dipeptide ABC transporter ATP-binding protein